MWNMELQVAPATKTTAFRGKARTGSMKVEMLFMESAKLGQAR